MNSDLIQNFESPESLAETAARDWLEELSSRAPHSGPYAVALSGGRITNTFFNALVDQAAETSSAFELVHFFWADDRCVGPDDADSNFKQTSELLFTPLNINTEQVHRIQGELEPKRAAELASADLTEFFAQRTEGDRRFDRIFLGMGEDGHTASLFPGESEDVMSDATLYRAVVASKPPPNRITLGYDVIANAKEVVALVSGSGKETALRESLSPKGNTPMARVIQSRGETRILTDVSL